VAIPVTGYSASVIAPCGDLNKADSTRYLHWSIDSTWKIRVVTRGRCTSAELPVGVVSPTVGGLVGRDGASVRESHTDGREAQTSDNWHKPRGLALPPTVGPRITRDCALVQSTDRDV